MSDTGTGGKHVQKTKRKKAPFALLGVAIIAVAVGLLWTALQTIPTNKYLGTWNYDQPDIASGVNVARLNGGGYTSGIPQIGTVTFTRDIYGDIIGRTDQGCTWHFKAHGDSLRLATTNQYCYNRTANLGYNIYEWNVNVDGSKEQEVLRAASYLPNGTFDFVLQNGVRTRSGGEDPTVTANSFTGTWNYQGADMATQFNIVTTVRLAPDVPPVVKQTPITGTITYSKGSGNTIIARTDNGCKWTLEAHGNTAELAPGTQTCKTDKGEVKLNFFAVASDGHQQTTIMSGIDEQGDIFLLIIGSLKKS